MALVPFKFIHTITSRKSAELVIVIVDVAATIDLGRSFTPFAALGVNTDSNLCVVGERPSARLLSFLSKRMPSTSQFVQTILNSGCGASVLHRRFKLPPLVLVIV